MALYDLLTFNRALDIIQLNDFLHKTKTPETLI